MSKFENCQGTEHWPLLPQLTHPKHWNTFIELHPAHELRKIITKLHNLRLTSLHVCIQSKYEHRTFCQHFYLNQKKINEIAIREKWRKGYIQANNRNIKVVSNNHFTHRIKCIVEQLKEHNKKTHTFSTEMHFKYNNQYGLDKLSCELTNSN